MKLERIDRNNDPGDYLVEMPSRGRLVHRGRIYELIVHYRENPVGYPHFHMHAIGTNYDSDICIRLDVAEYFIHSNHVETLNSAGRKKLDNYLREEIVEGGLTRWRILVNDWNEAFRPVDIKEMPNYRRLPDKA